MHMLSKDNNLYEIPGIVANSVIPSFTNLTFLFMTVSAFGMCIGYYEKVIEGKINLLDFYKKRYFKILPFFSLVVLIDVIYNHNLNSIIEAVPNLTLTRGLFPNNIGQIGVAWFLGLIFVFYMIFPFFCVLLSSKKSAWITFLITILLNYIVSQFYSVGRENFVYSAMFFVVGGLVYLYRDSIERKLYVWLPFVVASVVFYYLVGGVYACLLVSTALLILAISIKIKKNKIIAFLSGISMEVFLCHMVMFRVVEKVNLNTFFGNGWLQYTITCVLVSVGAGCFAFVSKKIFEKIGL